MFPLLIILLIIAVIIEGSITSLPLTLIVLLCLTTIRRDTAVFIAAFVAGIFLDIFALRQVGGASIFFITFVFLILLYQRKYEIYSYPFVLVGTFLGAALFLSIFNYANVLPQAGISVIAAFFLFACMRLFTKYQDSRPTELHYHA